MRLNESAHSPKIKVFHIFLRSDWVSSSHLKAVDVWVLLCYLEVFFALIEYCLVLYLIKGVYYWEPKPNQVQNEEVTSEYVSKEGLFED